MTDQPAARPKSLGFGRLSTALVAYRVMAFITGTVLLAGTIALVVKTLTDGGADSGAIGAIWIAHGYLFMAYLLVTVNLALHLRWHPVRALLTMAAGTVPTMSFVAERAVMRQIARTSS